MNGMLNSLLSLFKSKKPPTYAAHKIEYHARYEGTYMLFGYHAIRQEWLLLGETLFPTEADTWGFKHGCSRPKESHFENCQCCTRFTMGGQPVHV